MGINVNVISEEHGSNPGGNCNIYDTKPFIAYVKHCIGAKNMNGSSFKTANQPIYEAVTLEMARKLKLLTPDFFVLLNKDKDVHFEFEKGVKSRLKPNRPCYFVSKLININRYEDLDEANKILNDEFMHRDLLQVADVDGKKQNWFFNTSRGEIVYLDLGCNFVHATDGYMQLKHHHGKPLFNSELRKGLRNLSKYSLICADNKSLISLDKLVKMPYEIKIPVLNPKGKRRLDSLISTEEIREIVGRLVSGVNRELKRNKGSEYLIRN